jgi:hypothetical protein
MNKSTVFGGEAELVARAIDELHASIGIHGELLDSASRDADATVSIAIRCRSSLQTSSAMHALPCW